MSEQTEHGRDERDPERERRRPANPVVPLLLQALRGPDPHRELAAVAAAGPSAVPALTAALREGGRRVRRAAALALGYMLPHALPVAADLATALRDREAAVRRAAARALGALGPQARRALPHLARALADPDARVRRAVAKALAEVLPAPRTLAAGAPIRLGTTATALAG